jgi:CubicO group peptidase (beta-lactamase class C family)
MDSPFSSPKGSLFSKGSFGHTGYSGSSIWIDPNQDLFVILLTARRNYRDTGILNRLRRDISTVAAANFRPLTEALSNPQSGPVVQTGQHIVADGRRLIKTAQQRIKRTAQLHKNNPAAKRVHVHLSKSERRLAKAFAAKRAMTLKRRS